MSVVPRYSKCGCPAGPPGPPGRPGTNVSLLYSLPKQHALFLMLLITPVLFACFL